MAGDVPIRLLFDALEAGRAALRNRDDRDVPAKLRPVAASSSRSLPPPLAKSLLHELEVDEALRNEAAGQLPATAGRASSLFLTRPDGWREEYDRHLDEHLRETDSEAAGRDERRIADLEKELKLARARARDATKRAEAVRAEADARVAASRREIKAAGRSAAKRATELEALLEDSELIRQSLEAEVASLRGDIASLRAQRQKRDRARADAGRSEVGGDPLSMARALDHFLVTTQQHHLDPDTAQIESEHHTLPVGLAPDRADAVEWLLDSGVPRVWVVDGHNLAHRLDPPRFTDPDLRGEIAEIFARFRRRSAGPFRAVVVFDTRAPVSDTVQARPGVELVFVADADAEVVRLAGEHGERGVVISSDGEVRLAAAQAGSVVLWSEAVVESLRS